MMTVYRYGFSEPAPPPPPPPPNYTMWIVAAGVLLWAYKKYGWKGMLGASAASPAEEIAAGGSLL